MMKLEENNGRVRWIDAVRGLAVLMVIFGHCRIELNYFSRILVGCHVPLFFFVSGLCLTKHKVDRQWLKQKARTILWPFLTGSILYYLTFQYNSIIVDFISLCGFGPIWFLTTLFLGQVFLMHLITRFRNWQIAGILGMGLSIVVVLNFFSDLLSHRPVYLIARVIVSAFFIYTGYLFKDFELKKPFAFLAMFSVYITLSSIPNIYTFDLHYARIPNLIVYFTITYSGIGTFVLIARLLDAHTSNLVSYMQYIEKNSLLMMIVHYPLISPSVSFVEKMICNPLAIQIVTGFIITSMCLLICFIVNTNKYLHYFISI